MKDAGNKVMFILFGIVLSMGGWWANRTQNSIDDLTKATIELQARARYVSGEIPAVPIKTQLSAEAK